MKLHINSILFLFLILQSCASFKNTSYLEKENINLMKQIYHDFDLSSIKSSFGPRITDTQNRLSEFFTSDLVEIDKNEINIKDESWFYSFKLLERGDFNNDGIEDVKIEMTDQALKGTYFTVSDQILSRLSNNSKIVGISSKTIYSK